MPGLLVCVSIAAMLAGLAGCVNVQAPERIEVGSSPGREPIDTSRVPPTGSHEEARRKIAEAYQRIDYLDRKVRDLKEDKEKYKDERDEYKDKYKRLKKRYDD